MTATSAQLPVMEGFSSVMELVAVPLVLVLLPVEAVVVLVGVTVVILAKGSALGEASVNGTFPLQSSFWQKHSLRL